MTTTGKPHKTAWQEAVLRSELSPSEKVTALAMSMHADMDGKSVWPSQEATATVGGQALRTVQRNVPALREAGWLTRVRGAVVGHRGTEYRLTIPQQRPPDRGSQGRRSR